MADPRLSTSVNGVAPVYASFKIDNSTITYDATKAGGSDQVDLALRLVPGTDQTIELVGDGERVLGKLIKVESDDIATVQMAGGMTLPGGDSATLTIGAPIVGDLGPSSAEGYIRAAATASASPTQDEVNEARLCRGQITDASDTSNVEVYL